MKQDKYKVISLFSGGMGLDLGLEATGRFEVLACVEKEHAFSETIRRNRDAGRLPAELKVYEGDIADTDPIQVLEDLGLKPGEVDLVVGGPPCQSFSTAGRRRTVQDPRGTLLWQFLRYIEVMRPKFFLMENVRGLLSAALNHRPIAERPEKGGPPLQPDEEHGSVVRLFSEDLQRISDAAYHMDIFEVNSVNYGAPQIRERAIFIGNRFNSQVSFPDPTHGPPHAPKEPETLFDSNSNGMKPWATLKDAIGGLQETDPVLMDFSPRKKKFLAMVPPGANWRSLPEDMQRESMGKAWLAKGGRSGWWRRLTFDLPCPTLMTMPNHASTSLCHPTETRSLSLKEYAHIQEFPPEWEFVGRTAEQYAQAGNAVPVRLGRVSGEVVVGALDELRVRGWQSHKNAPAVFRVVYVQSHVRTRQWFKGGETFVWNDGSGSQDASYSPPKTKRRTSRL
jgi:DNA (cytosine-5)-methyltransferase 1